MSSIISADTLAQPQISCRTKDGHLFKVNMNVIRQSHTFENMYQDLNLAEEDPNFVFDMKVVTTELFHKVHQWMEQHIDAPEPVVKLTEDTKERIWFELTDQEKAFLDLPVEELQNLMTAASYLDIPSLLLFSAQCVASMVREKLKAKDYDGIRDMFGMEDDLTEEEKEQIRKDNPWCKYD